MIKQMRKLSQTRIIALGFILIIALGTLLLSLPFATKPGEVTTFTDAIFTATSATSTTGLITVDTFTHWTLFGQIAILVMIQIGGLGCLTIAVMFSMFLRKKIGLKMRGILQESVNANKLGGIIRLLKKVTIGTIIIEGTGAIALAIRFSTEMSVGKAIYYGVFHSVSAFCGAGFDLLGYKEEFGSVACYLDDPTVNLTIMLLDVIGGLGFIVWDDLSKKKLNFKKYSLHTKMVLSMTSVLIVVGALLFYIFEKDSLFADLSTSETIWGTFFMSVTIRSCGFSTLNIAGLTEASKMLCCVLMFIGGSPGSTAGGVKTVTTLVIIVYLWSSLRSSKSCNIFSRSISDSDVKKASNIVVIHMTMAVLAIITISYLNDLQLSDIFIEVFSAIGTVGVTSGITRDVEVISRYILMALMFCGRLGSMSFASTFTDRKNVAPVQLPKERIIIG